MAVLMIGEVDNLTAEIYGSMVEQMAPAMKAAPGFVSHTGGPRPNGWRVVEVWDSEADSERWFEENVRPNLPEGITPNRSFHELHTVITK